MINEYEYMEKKWTVQKTLTFCAGTASQANV